MAATATVLAPLAASGGTFNYPGDVLISDQFNDRGIGLDLTRDIVFQFSSTNPTLCNPGPVAVIAPKDAERLADGLTLIAGTGTSSCPENRMLIVDQKGRRLKTLQRAMYERAGISLLCARTLPFGTSRRSNHVRRNPIRLLCIVRFWEHTL